MTRLLAHIVVVAALASAADRSSWTIVRNIAPGAAVEALREDGKKFRGALTGATENQLALRTNDGPVRLGRSTIRKVGLKNEGRRARNAAIGAAAVGGAVAAAMILGCASCFGETDGYGGKVALGIAAGAGGGALIGWLIPAYQTIYEAPKGGRRP